MDGWVKVNVEINLLVRRIIFSVSECIDGVYKYASLIYFQALQFCYVEIYLMEKLLTILGHFVVLLFFKWCSATVINYSIGQYLYIAHNFICALIAVLKTWDGAQRNAPKNVWITGTWRVDPKRVKQQCGWCARSHIWNRYYIFQGKWVNFIGTKVIIIPITRKWQGCFVVNY